jgi:hypothetical protein
MALRNSVERVLPVQLYSYAVWVVSYTCAGYGVSNTGCPTDADPKLQQRQTDPATRLAPAGTEANESHASPITMGRTPLLLPGFSVCVWAT